MMNNESITHTICNCQIIIMLTNTTTLFLWAFSLFRQKLLKVDFDKIRALEQAMENGVDVPNLVDNGIFKVALDRY